MEFSGGSELDLVGFSGDGVVDDVAGGVLDLVVVGGGVKDDLELLLGGDGGSLGVEQGGGELSGGGGYLHGVGVAEHGHGNGGGDAQDDHNHHEFNEGERMGSWGRWADQRFAGFSCHRGLCRWGRGGAVCTCALV